ncbi:hypothetical protein IW140_005891 [Coemansia sp. RSA 1813]|nr:hypothetical protein EV178_005304 [Coemansia sp. RSA 1646]KAJ1766020.1 hypothetical protein LPJ74_006087 [Coemansia sp. RSA 1843]KAJ2086191.1 hypothetical protein IW138_005863 [Coemansia sp. RSA 986]KAJ2210902.1 hypothetical protein EV179_005891 [Coemansia sp. RSA 487]KAJ2564073.1 hypothetical protein IW140_005891 [Coemansia sp. RSA 1813]
MKVDDGMLAGALEYWRTLQLTTLLQELDETSLEIVDNQKTSLQERRKLAERTKEFRALDDTEKLNDFKPLLRAYQNEIDNLTKRMKYAENGFLRVFKSLNDAPDPQPFLSNLVDERKLLDEQQNEKEMVGKLKARVDELKGENARLREDTAIIGQLKQEVSQYETSMAQMVRDRAAEQEKDTRDQTDALITHLKEREGDLQRQLSAATRKLAQLQESKDAEEEERVMQVTPADRELVAKLAELEIVQADLDHANTRVTDLMAHNARLRQELSTVTGTTDSAAAAGSVAETLAEYRRRVRELDDETQRLFGELEKAQTELEMNDSKHRADVSGIETELQVKTDEVQRLRDQVQRYADYDEIKRDLDIMKSVEFSVSDWGMDDANAAAAGGEAAADEEDEEKSLERLLVRRNKSLENRLIDSKNQLSRCHGDLEELRLKVGALETKLTDKSSLAERLEADLVAVQHQQSGAGRNPEKMPATDDESSVAASNQQADGNSSGNVLDIVTSQRDRFRHRNMELEDELRMQGSQVSDMRRQVDQVKQDNLRLYEEVKYLRSYKSTTILGNDTAVVGMPSKFSKTQQHRVDMDTDVAAKYKGMYEESLNPFNAFHRRESTRRIRSMNILDRLIYIVANFVVGDRRARIGLIAYIGLLHLLVMVTLYRSTVQTDDSLHEATTAI